jgi:hypothetical protein
MALFGVSMPERLRKPSIPSRYYPSFPHPSSRVLRRVAFHPRDQGVGNSPCSTTANPGPPGNSLLSQRKQEAFRLHGRLIFIHVFPFIIPFWLRAEHDHARPSVLITYACETPNPAAVTKPEAETLRPPMGGVVCALVRAIPLKMAQAEITRAWVQLIVASPDDDEPTVARRTTGHGRPPIITPCTEEPKLVQTDRLVLNVRVWISVSLALESAVSRQITCASSSVRV